MNEWKELDINNLPSDILVDGAWELNLLNDLGDWNRVAGTHGDYLQYAKEGLSYRIRRPEGWIEPQGVKFTIKDDLTPMELKECPRCGSTSRVAFNNPGGCSFDNRDYHPWHDEPKAPTHEEIMTKWWRLDNGVWVKVWFYDPGSSEYRTGMTGQFRSTSWFTNRQSADIPPEKSADGQGEKT